MSESRESGIAAGLDPAMLSLFREELSQHVAVWERTLEALAGGRGRTGAAELEHMRQAAHAIWGSARVMEADTLAHLARALRECVVAAQAGRLAVDRLAQASRAAVEFLKELLDSPEVELFSYLERHAATLEKINAELEEVCSGASINREKAIPPPPASGGEEIVETEEIPLLSEDKLPSPSAAEPGETEPPTSPPSLAGMIPENLDPDLLALFMTELDTHGNTLSEGLLALEANPGARDQLDALMRAAHSIKGGARVVGLDPVVELAHRMEDCFVAAQGGTLELSPTHVDVLLRGLDMLNRLAGDAGAGPQRESAELDAEFAALLRDLDASRQGRGGEVSPSRPEEKAMPEPPGASAPEETGAPFRRPPPPAATAAEQPDDPPRMESREENQDRAVRVTAAKIERLMGLTGEVVVATRWIPPFSESLLALKRDHLELGRLLEKLHEQLNRRHSREALDPGWLKLLAQARGKTRDCNTFLAERLNQLDIFTNTLTTHSNRLYQEVIGVRMRPFADGARGFPRMVRDLARRLGKQVRFEIIGKSTEVDQDILEKLDAPLNHLLRNALDHGLESPAERLAVGKPEQGSLRLEVGHRSGMLMVDIRDDGRGIDLDVLRAKVRERGLAGGDMLERMDQQELLHFLFLPGFSTSAQVTEISGRGVGLDVVHGMVHEVGGVVRASTRPGQGATFHLELPLTLSVIRTFLVEIGGEPYAFPLARLERCLLLSREEIETVEDRQYFRFTRHNIALVNIHEVLELDSQPPGEGEINVVVVSDRLNAYGLVVDRFLGEYDLVVRPLDPRLGRLPDINAAAVMLDGSPVLIFDVEDLIHSINKILSDGRLRKISSRANQEDGWEPASRRILVVDDSITVREMERKLLEHHGYEVEIAVDGLEGWTAVRGESFDMVVTDVDMPRMNGIEFIKRIREHEALNDLPVIIVSYRDSQEHRLQGLDAGANYYLTKSSFEDNSFINAVVDLIGEARDAH